MNLNRDKYMRFSDRNSEDSFSPESSSNRWRFVMKKLRISFVLSRIQQVFDMGSERVKSFRKFPNRSNNLKKETTKPDSKRKILDPQGSYLQKWNKIFVFSCIIAVSLDPLFFYIPVFDGKNFCLSLDRNLEIIACVLRSCADLFYLYHIFLQFRTGFVPSISRVFGRGELVEDSYAIAKRYLASYFIVDVLSILPLPQILIIMVIPSVNSPVALVTKDLMTIVIFTQYIPRLFRIYPLYTEVTRTSGIFTETAWAGAAFNLFLYMLASHVFGAFWYLFSIERKDSCWRIACGKNQCKVNDLYCGGIREGNISFLNSSCLLLAPENIKTLDDFNFGIFLDAHQSRISEQNSFRKKFFYCFWWGLRSLSSLGQNLKTSDFVGEILFAVAISVIGLILFALLIGNMQKYLQSITVRVEEMRVKRRDAERWMSHRMLPETLRQRIRRHDQYKWQQTRGVEEDALIRNLPKDLRKDLKRHLCWTLLTRVPMFEKMDEQLLDEMCLRLKPVLYTENSFIIREGDPVDEMLFIMRGDILTMTTNGGRTGFFNSVSLTAGNFCGEELLTWALDPNSSLILPISTRTVTAMKDVEAFALMADDIKTVAAQFRRLNNKQLQHTFRFCSLQWRTWGACFIQVAWRRHCRRKMERSLKEAEDRRQEELAKEGSGNLTSIRSTIYASKFATNMLESLRRKHPINTRIHPKLPPLLLQKPSEPDFSAENISS